MVSSAMQQKTVILMSNSIQGWEVCNFMIFKSLYKKICLQEHASDMAVLYDSWRLFAYKNGGSVCIGEE